MRIISMAVGTPIGEVELLASDRGLCRVLLPGQSTEGRQAWVREYFESCPVRGTNTILELASGQLSSYFREGLPDGFDLPLDLKGSLFQQWVWSHLACIPYGAVVSYQELASSIGRPRSARAVGAANSANPFPIVLPCHRVVGSNRELVGFSGGLDTKIALLELEGLEIKRDSTRKPEKYRVRESFSR
jgi:O-6-methylguanine DNA methyltransferase